jgi:hypothetical protein
MYTDLDLLLARLEEREGGIEDPHEGEGAGAGERGETQGGGNYDVRPLASFPPLPLLTLVPLSLFRLNEQDLLLLSDVLGTALPVGASPLELSEHLTVAPVECERRRVTKSGKVKSKLSCVGVRCVDCAVRLPFLFTFSLFPLRRCCQQDDIDGDGSCRY